MPAPAYYDVKQYGALGDGTTDDTVAVQSAISSACSAGSGVVFFPAGRYLFSSPLNVVASAIRLQGSGRGISILISTATFGVNGTSRGIIQFTSGPAQFVGNEVCDLGFDMTASNEPTVNLMSAIFQDGVPMSHVAFRRLHFEQTGLTDGLHCNGLGQGIGSSDIVVEDIWDHNGSFGVGLFANGKQTNALVSGIVVRNVYALVDEPVLDDRIIISANNGGSGNSEVRDVVVENIFVNVVFGASGTVNGVKLDCGTFGYMHRVAIHQVYMSSIAGISGNAPVYMQGQASRIFEDIDIDGVQGDMCGRLHLLFYRNVSASKAPYFTVRNVRLRNCVDAIAGMELYCGSTPADEQVSLENIDLHFSTTVSGNIPVGILLTSGNNLQGAGGVVAIHDVSITSASIGITNTINESGSVQASAWSNIFVRNATMSGVTTRFNFGAGTKYKISDCPGYNPVGSLVAPAIPASTTAYTNTFGVDCTVFVSGGTVSVIAIGGTPTGLSSGSFRVPANQTIALTYAVAPSWTWFGD